MNFRFWIPTSPQRLLREALAESQREHISHQIAASHYQALADMYAARVVWVQAQIQNEAPAEPLPSKVRPIKAKPRLGQIVATR